MPFQELMDSRMGLLLNLCTQAIFGFIRNICGGLRLVDTGTLNCDEIRWVRLELASGDLRAILRLFSAID